MSLGGNKTPFPHWAYLAAVSPSKQDAQAELLSSSLSLWKLNSGPGLAVCLRSLLVNGFASRSRVTLLESQMQWMHFQVFSLSTQTGVT